MVINPRGIKNDSGKRLVRTKKRRYKILTRNIAITIRLPTNKISGSDKKRREMENPKRIKKNVLIRKDVSAVTECSKCRNASTCSCGKYFNTFSHFSFSQLLISRPNTRIIISDGK